MRKFLMLFLCFISTLIVDPAYSRNLIRNSSFENGYTSWSWGGNGDQNKGQPYIAITTTNSPHTGTRHIRLECAGLTGDFGNSTYVSEYYRGVPGSNYSLTFWGKTSLGSFTLNSWVKNTYGLQDNLYQASLTTTWTRFTNSFTATNTSLSTYQIQFSPQSQSTPGVFLFIDDIQLELGSATTYAPRNDIEVGFDINYTNAANVFTAIQTPQLPAIYYNNTANSSNITVIYNSFNALNQLVKSNSLSVTAPSGRSTNWLDLSLTTNVLGSFRTIVWISNVADSQIEVIHTVVPVPAGLNATSSKFGTHTRFYPDWLNPLNNLGMKFVRTLSVNKEIARWGNVETTSNVFTFVPVMITNVITAGLEPVITLGEEILYTPAYALDGAGLPRLTDWLYYLTNTVNAYKDNVKYWEVWNEPEDEGGLAITGGPLRYTEILTNAFKTIHALDSDSIVLGMVTYSSEYMDLITNNAGRAASNYMDILATHNYSPDLQQSVIDRVGDRAIEWGLELWNTEQGERHDPFQQSLWWEDFYISDQLPDNPRDYRIRAGWIGKNFVDTSSPKMTKNLYYDGRPDGLEHPINYSIFDPQGSVGPQGTAIAILASFADGGTNYSLTSFGNNSYGRVFGMRDNTNSLLIVYTTSVAPSQKSWITTTRPNYAFFDSYGNKLTSSGGAGFDQVPIYLIATNTTPSQLLSACTVSIITDTNPPIISFTRFPTSQTNEGGWVKWFAQDDVAIVPRLGRVTATNEMEFAYNIGAGWTSWGTTNSVLVSSGNVVVQIAARDIVGNASTNVLYLGSGSSSSHRKNAFMRIQQGLQ